jgi:hypothetical protein
MVGVVPGAMTTFFGWIREVQWEVFAFCLGFFLSWILGGRLIDRVKKEKKDLKYRLQNEEGLLSGRLSSIWPEHEGSHRSNNSQKDLVAERTNPSAGETMESPLGQKVEEPDKISVARTRVLQESLLEQDVQERLSDSTRRRKVRITKRYGRDNKIKLQTSLVGLEDKPPDVGKNYRVFTKDGKVFTSSPVTKVAGKLIHTKNSTYEIDVLN